MNFLGHLFFSNNELQLMHANLYGDFVKGKDLSQFDSTIQTGIRLHRKIDSYIDHHPDVLQRSRTTTLSRGAPGAPGEVRFQR
jgi:acyl carrier protein phosphodiesterase